MSALEHLTETRLSRLHGQMVGQLIKVESTKKDSQVERKLLYAVLNVNADTGQVVVTKQGVIRRHESTRDTMVGFNGSSGNFYDCEDLSQDAIRKVGMRSNSTLPDSPLFKAELLKEYAVKVRASEGGRRDLGEEVLTLNDLKYLLIEEERARTARLDEAKQALIKSKKSSG